MTLGAAIPVLDAAPFFAPDEPARRVADAALMQAAAEAGFVMLRNVPDFEEACGPAARAALRSIFAIRKDQKRALMRVSSNPASTNVYRGWFPLTPGDRSYKEGIDIGPDIARPATRSDDPLREPTPMPPEAAAPGFAAAAARWHGAMEQLGGALMAALARGLGLPEDAFAPLFADGISTLRIARYPARDAASFGGRDPAPLMTPEHARPLSNVAHVDSGFVTLLAQDGTPGLEAETKDGRWIAVPPDGDLITVNFGKLLAKWTGGAVRATPHRVAAPPGERFSFPFFHEPAAEAVIEPLPGFPGFPPFSYGDFLWEATTGFVEQRGVAHLRPPRGP